MISTVAARKVHIESLQIIAAENELAIRCLIIAHNDSILAERLGLAFADEAAALLQVPQSEWEMEHGELLQSIEWALEQYSIQRIVLVGDSSSYLSKCGVTLLDQSGPTSPGLGLYDRVKRAQGLRKHAEHDFANQLKSFLNSTQVASRIAENKLVVDGLFYRSEAGVFACYDEKDDSFLPIGPI